MAGSSATSTKSVQNAKKELQKFLRRLDIRPAQILEAESQALYSDIIAKTPYETGKLERSVRVSVSKNKSRPGISASASARSKSGYNYAGIQHENESFRHPIKGQAHYISEPFEKAIARIVEKTTKELTPPGGS